MFNKKNTYEQHDNENGSFYKSSIKPYNSSDLLNENLEVDVCVVGGGLTGVSSALNLAKKGYSVAICESRLIGWGASGRNGGQLGIGMRKDQPYIEKKLGFDNAKELWKIGLESVEEALKLISEYNISCNLQNGVISAGCFETDIKDFDNEINHLEKYYNFINHKILTKNMIRDEINSELYFSGLINYGSYHINPLKYLLGIAEELKKYNVKIYENTPVSKIIEKNDHILTYANQNLIKSNYVVVGCNGYLDKLLGNIRSKFMPINNYIIATEPLGEKKAKEIIKNNHAVCDTRFIIDYYRFSEDWRMIFGGGETYSAKFIHNSKNFVWKRMCKVFPMLKDYKIEYSWGGTLAITVNRLPNFGTLMNQKLLYAHGYSGHGIALSTLAGKLITEKIQGYDERFDLFSKIKHISIPGGDLIRRPIYSSAVGYFKFRDTFSHKINI